MKRSAIAGILIAVLIAPLAHADTLTVTAQSFNFAPATDTIQLGDTVHWVWVNGSHTVTSGTGAADPNKGTLFDSPISVGTQNFFYTFSDTSGTYPYHCTPHEFLQMKGTIVVEEPIVTNVAGPEAPMDEFKSWTELKELFD